MTNRRTYDPANKDQVFATLRHEILAARLKVALDERLRRETSPTVKRLANMKLPPMVRPDHQACDAQAEAVAWRVADVRAGNRKTVAADAVGRDLDLED
ncbi:hypothetical protein [Arthrobacter sp. GMC3]|uniref:hypothetical protein n=1 Tax=Arthrobacter sp. GMC3 TaxID=2058894 RepID=UPI000CE3AC40|nr:hypothetical protein [Arthrobacter sp. GMC3]